MPISRHARLIRTAISPRLAIRIFFTEDFYCNRLQRDVAVLLGRILVALGLETLERRHELPPRLSRLNHFVDEAAARGHERAGKLLTEFLHLFPPPPRRIGRRVELALVENIDRALGPHHGELSGGPRVIEIGANVLAGHDAVGAAV